MIFSVSFSLARRYPIKERILFRELSWTSAIPQIVKTNHVLSAGLFILITMYALFSKNETCI